LDDKIRIVPGGSAIRDGSFVGENVVLMPPCYVNVGAYVGEGTMIDSHALVGSCAQSASAFTSRRRRKSAAF
jgi:2,3,4,5-tetrahydropyridine-2-carboxylate N-succinyltransferase